MSAEPINPNQPSQPSKIRPRKILQHPSSTSITRISQPTTPKRLTASLNPKDFIHEFSLIEELTDNKELYTGDEWITLHAFPSSLYTSVRRAKEWALDCHLKVGISSIIACCIQYGIKVIKEDSDIKAMAKLRHILYTTEEVRANELEELVIWFRTFPLTLVDSSGTGTRKQTCVLPNAIKLSLSSSAEELGLSSSSLAALAIAESLCDWESTHPDRRIEIRGIMDAFLSRVRIRRRVAEVWMRELGVRI